MRAWYAEAVATFLARDPADVLGRLTTESALRHTGDQTRQSAMIGRCAMLVQPMFASDSPKVATND
jgi:hypothetical protein